MLAFVGHWRIIDGTTDLSADSMPGKFLVELQEAVQRGSELPSTRTSELALQVLERAAPCDELPDPPFERWWSGLPATGAAIPTDWQPYDLGARIIDTALTTITVSMMYEL